jgi:hypothetical protein
MGPLPEQPDSLYLHDLHCYHSSAVPGWGTVATRMVVDIAIGNRLDEVSLLAVNGADTFWKLHGFVPSRTAHFKSDCGGSIQKWSTCIVGLDEACGFGGEGQFASQLLAIVPIAIWQRSEG